jgi:hypothetical protein
MEAQGPLDCSIQHCPQSLEARHHMVQGFWDTNSSFLDFQSGHQCDKYFSYYAEQCRLALYDGGQHILPRTHRDVIEMAAHLRNSVRRHELKDILRPNLPDPPPSDADEILDNTIDLTARLLLMVNVGSFQYGVSENSQLSWRDGTVNEFLQGRFRVNKVLEGTSIKLEKIFNARNLQRIAGIQIIWTDNLADHLSMRDDDTRVAIFHHASFLQCQERRYVLD